MMHTMGFDTASSRKHGCWTGRGKLPFCSCWSGNNDILSIIRCASERNSKVVSMSGAGCNFSTITSQITSDLAFENQFTPLKKISKPKEITLNLSVSWRSETSGSASPEPVLLNNIMPTLNKASSRKNPKSLDIDLVNHEIRRSVSMNILNSPECCGTDTDHELPRPSCYLRASLCNMVSPVSSTCSTCASPHKQQKAMPPSSDQLIDFSPTMHLKRSEVYSDLNSELSAKQVSPTLPVEPLLPSCVQGDSISIECRTIKPDFNRTLPPSQPNSPATPEVDTSQEAATFFENMKTAPVLVVEGAHDINSFLTSSEGSHNSDASCDNSSADNSPSFYHRVDNSILRTTRAEHKARTRRRLIFTSSESASSTSSERANTNKENDTLASSRSSVAENDLPKSPLRIRQQENVPQPSFKVPDKPKGRRELRLSDESLQTLDFVDSLFPLTVLPAWVGKRRRHPSAERYLKKFKLHRKDLASRLLSIFNEVVFDSQLPADMEVEWNPRLLKTAGQCKYLRRRITGKNGVVEESHLVRIELAPKVCSAPERVRDTLLHEACHAAVWLVDGVNDGHGPCWRNWARRASARLPRLPSVSVCHAYTIDTRFTYECTGCGATINRHSKSLDIEKKVCGRCHSKFRLLLNTQRGRMQRSSLVCSLDKRYRSISAAPLSQDFRDTAQHSSSTRQRPVFADFVKQNYKSIRSQPDVRTHGEAMNQLGALFKSMKVSALNPETSVV